MWRRFLIAALIAWFASPALATSQPRDATDLWIDPAESGWGLNLFHQDDTLFGSLFVYGPDGQPKWYTASALTGGPIVYSGALIEATGPWFGAPTFDPKSVTRRVVGTMTFTLGDPTSGVSYTIDGVKVSKLVSRFSFKATTLGGTYVASINNRTFAELKKDIVMSVGDDGTTVTMATADASQSCIWSGAHQQNGQYENVEGHVTCGSEPQAFWSMSADVTTSGFTGTITGHGFDGARIVAVARGYRGNRGPGWRNDLYFPPDEAGWGINIVEQGGVEYPGALFGTLFVYDRDGRPRWFSIPDFHKHDIAGEQIYWWGTVYESTGPYFGTTFNPAAVTRRAVGSATFTTWDDNRPARFSFSVDGTNVSKEVTRYTFKKENFSGTFVGQLTSDSDGSYQPMTISIDDGAAFSMRTTSPSRTCDYAAPMMQSGHLRMMSGTYSCSDGKSGKFALRDAVMAGAGFTAKYDIDGHEWGHIGGAAVAR